MTRFTLGALTMAACWAFYEYMKNPMGHRGGRALTEPRGPHGDDRHGPGTVTLPYYEPPAPRPGFLN